MLEFTSLVDKIAGDPQGTRDYIAEMSHSGRSLMTDRRITVDSATPPIEVVVRNSGSRVEGTVRGAIRRGTTATAVLVPQPPGRQSLVLYRSVGVNSRNSSFAFPDVAPGSYKLFAWESAEPGAFLNSQFLARYEARGFPVDVVEGANIQGLQVDLLQ